MIVRPPIAPRRPHALRAHGETRTDEYYWLRDDSRRDPEVLAYLEAENDYLRAVTGRTDPLRKALYQEMVARHAPRDASVPYRVRDFWYLERYEAGQDHPVYVRRPGRPDGPDEVLLDENALAAGHDYYLIGAFDITRDERWLAWTADHVSRRTYEIRIKDLRTGEILPETISHVSPDVAWAADGRTLFYVRLQQGTLVPYQVWRHERGTPVADDVLVYEEADPTFSLDLEASRDGRHLMLDSSSTLSTEVRLLDVASPHGRFEPVLPREPAHEYSVDPLGDMLYVRTNWQARNFRIARAPRASSADRRTWQDVVPHRDDVFLGDFTVFDGHLVVEEVVEANRRLRVVPLDGRTAFVIGADEPAFTAQLDENPNTDTVVLRYDYSSPTTPDTVIDVDLERGMRTTLKREFAGDGFDPARYQTIREMATARDGTRVPVTLLARADARPDGTHPLYLLGYGAYGLSYDPEFRRAELSLVDRGFVFALAHVRGGQEMGRQWYEDGRLLRKTQTFTDFIDVAKHLTARGWADPARVVGSGRSAGGLLIGAVANMAPETFTVLTTAVPFVDVVTTMLDDSIPLTTFEYDEWGDPREERYYRYMLSYSPYDQVRPQAYPHVFVATGLWDSQVQYWEPAKWVARLRAHKTDANLLVLHTDMTAGHSGGSGRFDSLEDRAREYAFVLDVLGLADAGPRRS